MNMRYTCYSVLVLLLSQMSSCQHKVHYLEGLTEAEIISAQDPRRAVEMVDSLASFVNSEDEGQWADYALIRTKVYDRAYIRHTSDSTILRVIDYYEKHPEEDRLAWAYCYAGRVYRDLGDSPRAMVYFQRSLDASTEGGDANLRARVLSQMGYVYSRQGLYAEARAVKQQVLAIDSLNGNWDRMVVGYKDLAHCSFALHQLNQAQHYIARALGIIEQEKLENLKPEVQLLQARIANEQGLYDEALSLLCPYLADTTLLDPVPYWVAGCIAYRGLNNDKEAELLCLQILADSRNIHARYKAARTLTEIAQRHGNQSQMNLYLGLSAQWLDTIASQLDQSEDIKQISSLYSYQLREKENKLLAEEVIKSRIWLIVSLLSMLCAVLVLALVWHRNKRRQMAIRLQRSRIQQLQAELSMRDQSIEELSVQLSLRRATAENFDETFRTSELYSMVKGHINSQTVLSAREWESLVHFFEEYLPEFLPHLRQLYDFSEVEWRLSLLVRLSLRNVEIATLLCKHPSAITYAKKRLCIKVLNTEAKAEIWDEFVMKL